ncbi:MAG TPA: MBL fold metallo-hydrolase [Acidiphilium sp.]|uniref:MBL fold metallo-hydrolase n=1 Tax=Acidiphilium acidophilum TaxID=76588 RepID=A0AAW9DJY9_ACIAO|nr:MBL fold metallo-hydrolase [Acidiphilium acidophilum]MDX5929246.1 MBL fold metallo-hydrolase [Acidiphilium acidophilum]OYV88891.1 MAG: MBL fold metallo-hydrolase [Acidiphilium sp. 37-60-79]HQT89924.1 MBL fold metallo-hydrolase [Acidiphilium sp.]
MILRQFLHAEPTAASYLLGCVGKGVGVVVDPLFPIEPYLDAAAAAGTPISLVIDTHLHADHRSAGRALAEAAGAEYALHASADASYAYRRLVDGEQIELGNVVLDILHTPGHTPEHLCLLVTDRTRADEPWCLLGGHTLMVGDVGRTELAADAATGARALFASLVRLKALPDYVEVLPGALAGSVCGRGLSGKPGSTIGFERRHNAALQIDDQDTFVAFMLQNIPPAPPQAVELRTWNAGTLPKHAA